MSTGENIRNAVQVLYRTYESVSKMMEQTKSMAENAGYIVKSDKFLRWRTDGDPSAWLINNFILVFQSGENEACISGNNWRNGPVYTMEICLSGEGAPDGLPHLLLSRFEYKAIEEWPDSCSPADYWGFHQPTNKAFTRQFTRVEKDGLLFTAPTGEKASDAYWGLERAITSWYPLLEVTSSNLSEVVFGTFDKLAKIE